MKWSSNSCQGLKFYLLLRCVSAGYRCLDAEYAPDLTVTTTPTDCENAQCVQSYKINWAIYVGGHV